MHFHCSRYLRALTHFLSCLLLSAAAHSDDLTGIYEQALQSFQHGEYRQAIDGFQQARDGGLDSASLHYNLGVSHYKLRQYDEAKASFLEAAKSPATAALAYYNLGLIAAQQDDLATAEKWLKLAIAESDNPKLHQLANAMLDRIDGGKPSTRKSLLPWSSLISAGIGYDDNVTLTANDQTISTAGKGDSYLDVFAYVDKALTRDNGEGFSIDASLYHLDYDDLDKYNIQYVHAGISYDKPLDGWMLNSGLHMTFTFLDGDAFSRTTTVNIDGKKSISPSHQLRLDYDLSRIKETDAAYAYLAGWQHQATATSAWSVDGKRFRFSYRLELNNRADLQTTRFTSYSPTRHTLRAIASTPIGNGLTASLDLAYRHSRYNDPDQLADSSIVTRTEDRTRLSGKLSRKIGNNREVSARYSHTDNDSNINSHIYKRGQFDVNLNILW